MPDNNALEERLRAHLGRVAQQAPDANFERRISDRATGKQPPTFAWNRVAVYLAVAALTMLIVVALSGHETSTVFCNISNGLNTH